MVPLHTENISVGLDYRVCFLVSWQTCGMQVSSILDVQPKIGMLPPPTKELYWAQHLIPSIWWLNIP